MSCSVVTVALLLQQASLVLPSQHYAVSYMHVIAGKLNKSGQQMDVWENFRDYNLTPPVGLIRADAHRLPFRPALQVHASFSPFHIVCTVPAWKMSIMVALQCRITVSTHANVPQL